jgi:hypothetical protein
MSSLSPVRQAEAAIMPSSFQAFGLEHYVHHYLYAFSRMTRPRPPYRHGHRGSSSSRTYHTGSPRSISQNSDGSRIPTENRSSSGPHYRERISTEERTAQEARATRLQTAANILVSKACEIRHDRQHRNEHWENIKKRITGQGPELLPTGVEIGELMNAVSELRRDQVQLLIAAIERNGMDSRSRFSPNRMFAGLCGQRGGVRQTRRSAQRRTRQTRKA